MVSMPPPDDSEAAGPDGNPHARELGTLSSMLIHSTERRGESTLWILNHKALLLFFFCFFSLSLSLKVRFSGGLCVVVPGTSAAPQTKLPSMGDAQPPPPSASEPSSANGESVLPLRPPRPAIVVSEFSDEDGGGVEPPPPPPPFPRPVSFRARLNRMIRERQLLAAEPRSGDRSRSPRTLLPYTTDGDDSQSAEVERRQKKDADEEAARTRAEVLQLMADQASLDAHAALEAAEAAASSPAPLAVHAPSAVPPGQAAPSGQAGPSAAPIALQHAGGPQDDDGVILIESSSQESS